MSNSYPSRTSVMSKRTRGMDDLLKSLLEDRKRHFIDFTVEVALIAHETINEEVVGLAYLIYMVRAAHTTEVPAHGDCQDGIGSLKHNWYLASCSNVTYLSTALHAYCKSTRYHGTCGQRYVSTTIWSRHGPGGGLVFEGLRSVENREGLVEIIYKATL